MRLCVCVCVCALTTVVHAVEPGEVGGAEVEALADEGVEGRDGGGDGGHQGVLVEGEWPVVHDGLVVVRRVQVRDEVVLVLVEVVLLPCRRNGSGTFCCQEHSAVRNVLLLGTFCCQESSAVRNVLLYNHHSILGGHRTTLQLTRSSLVN